MDSIFSRTCTWQNSLITSTFASLTRTPSCSLMNGSLSCTVPCANRAWAWLEQPGLGRDFFGIFKGTSPIFLQLEVIARHGKQLLFAHSRSSPVPRAEFPVKFFRKCFRLFL